MHLHLLGDELGVLALLDRHELVVPPLLGDAPALDDADAVGVADGREAVRDHEHLVRVRARVRVRVRVGVEVRGRG